jgi:hypothetical protein
VLAALHRSGEVLSETAEDEGVRLSVRLEASEAGRFDEFRVDRSAQDEPDPVAGPREVSGRSAGEAGPHSAAG